MKKLKKLTAILLAMLSTLSLGVFAGCNEEGTSGSSTPSTESSTPSDNSSSSSSSSTGSGNGNNTNGEKKFSDWVQTKAPSCTQTGEKIRTNLADSNDVERAVLPMRPHSYSEDNTDALQTGGKMGVCTVCGASAVLPTLPENQVFETADQTNDLGYEFYDNHRLELSEGCYSVRICSTGVLWLSFSVSQAGQYALFSVGGDKDTEAQRFNASEEYVNEYGGIPATVENDNFLGVVNCGEQYFSSQWRATFRLTGTADTKVKICFVRIADPIWAPKTVTSMVYPTEIKGEKAPAPEAGTQLAAVSYDQNYFFDEDLGYYRLGTPSAPGAVIYTAITKKAENHYGDASIVSTFESESGGPTLFLSDGTNADGDIKQLSYVSFIYNCADDNNPDPTGAKDTNKNCYMNFCNSDGVYPVNRELYQFLNLYVRKNQPVNTYDDKAAYDADMAKDWRAHKNEDGADADRNIYWLSTCYYYEQIQVGTQSNPKVLEAGDNTITIAAGTMDYYVKVPQDGSYKLECTTTGVSFFVDGGAAQTSPVTVTSGASIRLRLGSVLGGTITIKLTKTA